MKTKPFSFAICLALSFCVLSGCAEEKTQPSTVCNDDGTVTFYYSNPNAKEVLVDVQFAGRNPMERDENGLWTVTLGP
ncbi:MAG: hypothetical protein J6Y05_06980, partial [Bacteroidales bacterium]|nr:hypothetical protein [Bacteroidales bacterium]